MREQFERQAGRYLRLLHELRLADDEKAAVSGDREAVQRLLDRLRDEPTPGSPNADMTANSILLLERADGQPGDDTGRHWRKSRGHH